MSRSTIDLEEAVREILERRAAVANTLALLIGISGVDGCGKGYLATQTQIKQSPRELSTLMASTSRK